MANCPKIRLLFYQFTFCWGFFSRVMGSCLKQIFIFFVQRKLFGIELINTQKSLCQKIRLVTIHL